nr:MAG TPA: hypothetical protein [Crassvirales sp.]
MTKCVLTIVCLIIAAISAVAAIIGSNCYQSGLAMIVFFISGFGMICLFISEIEEERKRK